MTAHPPELHDAGMERRFTPTGLPDERASQAPGWLVDEMLDCYLRWRLAERAECDAYQEWASVTGTRTERGLRFAAYLESVDQEESAACSYARAVRAIELRLARKALAPA